MEIIGYIYDIIDVIGYCWDGKGFEVLVWGWGGKRYSFVGWKGVVNVFKLGWVVEFFYWIISGGYVVWSFRIFLI